MDISGLESALSESPLAFIATYRRHGIYAYGVRLHWRDSLTWHWGGVLHTQPAELQMYGLLRVLQGLSPPLKLKAIFRSDYVSAVLVMAAKWKRDAERGKLKDTLKCDVEAWIETVTLWELFGVGSREYHTETEFRELRLAERKLEDLFYEYPSPFGVGDELKEGGDPLPFQAGEF